MRKEAGSMWRYCGLDKERLLGHTETVLDKNAGHIIQRKHVNAFFPF